MSWTTDWRAGFAVVAVLVVSCMGIPASTGGSETAGAQHRPWIEHTTFEDFAGGTLGDGGSNIYVSASGRIQMIHRWDLNNDGHLDLLVGQTHHTIDNSDALIYWGAKEGPRSIMPPIHRHQPLSRLLREIRLREKGVTRLSSDGGGRCLICDLNNDNLPEIIFCNYIHNFTVYMDALVYWGTPNGYSERRCERLPTLMAKAVAAADFNRDGYLDLAFANEGIEMGKRFGCNQHLESYIYWNGPTGFADRRLTKIASVSATDCAAGDLNGDGFPELLFVNNNENHKSIYIYFNAAGKFSEERREIRRGGDPVGAEIFDANGDGRLDLVVMHGQSRRDGPPIDANGGDGRLDLVVMHADDRAEILLGTENGLAEKPWLVLPILGAVECRAADLNKDGFVDLVFPNTGTPEQQHSYIYWGGPDGFTPQRRTELPSLNAADACIADFNRDGWLDVALANRCDSETHDVNSYIYFNSPQGFHPACRSALQSFGAVAAAAADLNRDGHQDLVLVNRLSGMVDFSPSLGSYIYWGNSRHFYSPESMTILPTSSDTMAHADVNDDGYVDIVFPNGHLYWGGPQGYSPRRRRDLDIENGGAVSAADLNRDGYLDLVIPCGSPFLFLKGEPNIGLILWGSKRSYDLKHATRLELGVHAGQSAAIADLNKDGFLDLIFPDVDSPHVDFFWGDASGDYSTKRHTTMEVISAATVEIADLNADGWLDMYFGGAYDKDNFGQPMRHSVLLWGSSSGYSMDRSLRLEGYDSEGQAVADLNKDGYLDIVTSNYHAYTIRSLPVFIYWGGPDGTYKNSRRTELPAESVLRLTVADLNQDSWLDIVAFNHQVRGDHGVGTNIFWGGPEGYSYDRRHWLQTFGVHFGQRRDIGNIYHRRLEETYCSLPLECPSGSTPSRLRWKAQTHNGTAVKFQIRTAPTAGKLRQAEWRGPKGTAGYYMRSGEQLHMPANHRWVQYRAVLTTPDGGGTPLLDEVRIDVRPERPARR